MSGVDLNLIGRYSEFFRGVAREYRQDAVRPTHGFSAMEHIHADCCALRRRRWVRTLCCAEQYPSFIHVSDGKLHDVHALDLLLPEAGAIYVMDRGYVDLARLHVLHLAGAFFVTRAKSY